jgi:two-component system nitrogen regulation sensor histidine kinase NtrY
MRPKLSLRARIFTAMISLVLIASVLIAGVTIYQYREQSNQYHEQRLQRKEAQLQTRIEYILSQSPFPNREEFLDSIFGEVVFQISDEQNVNFRIYSTEGTLITNTQLPPTEGNASISESTLAILRQHPTTNHVEITEDGQSQNRSSYSFISNKSGVAIGVLNLSYVDDDSLSAMELQNFLSRLMQVYLFILGVAIILAYVVSRFITKSLEEISDKITQTALGTANQKIDLNPPGKELSKLINAYNDMVDQLAESAVRLAKSEREQAWREMAKQVAHEIKNPLTPMRLSVQSFEQQFDPKDPSVSKKIEEFSSTLIHQIDTLSTIASAFSDFAEMPVQKSELLDVVKITQLALDIFTEKHIVFEAPNEPLFARLDRTQLIRILTNLVKNAIQACDEVPEPSIVVRVEKKSNKVCIRVTDNGHGITQEHIDKIFEPKFTTKTSGMGLGLAMVKNIVETYDGQIEVESSISKGTSFSVWLPFVNSTA